MDVDLLGDGRADAEADRVAVRDGDLAHLAGGQQGRRRRRRSGRLPGGGRRRRGDDRGRDRRARLGGGGGGLRVLAGLQQDERRDDRHEGDEHDADAMDARHGLPLMSASQAHSGSAADARRMSDSPRFWTSIRVFTVDLDASDNAKYINLVFRREHVGAGHFSPPPHERIRMGLNRRDVLKLGLFSSAALMLPAERLARAKLAVADRMPTSRLPKPFTVPFGTPPVLEPTLRASATDYYNIVQKQAGVEILPGYTTRSGATTASRPARPSRSSAAASRSSARPTTCPTRTRRCATTSGRRRTSTGRRRCRSTTATRATSRPRRLQGLPLPERPAGADALVPRPRRAQHRGERLLGPRRAVPHARRGRARAAAAGPVRRAADRARRDLHRNGS